MCNERLRIEPLHDVHVAADLRRRVVERPAVVERAPAARRRAAGEALREALRSGDGAREARNSVYHGHSFSPRRTLLDPPSRTGREPPAEARRFEPEVERGERVAHLVGMVAEVESVVRVAVRMPSVAPAFDGGVVEQGTVCITATCVNFDHTPVFTQIHEWQIIAHL